MPAAVTWFAGGLSLGANGLSLALVLVETDSACRSIALLGSGRKRFLRPDKT